jgi:hypothetical protein
MQTLNGAVIIADLAGSTRHAKGTTTGNLGSGRGVTTGEPRRTEVTEAGGRSILSKVVALSVVQGVEQAGVAGWTLQTHLHLCAHTG